MSQFAISDNALQRVVSFTNISENDRLPVAAIKIVSGVPLKISVVVFAVFELLIRTAGLIALSPFHLLKGKTFSEMTETIKSSARIVLDATSALASIRTVEKKITPAATAPQATWKRLLAYVQERGAAGLAVVKENPKMAAAIAVGTLTAIALCYSYPSVLSYLQGGGERLVPSELKQAGSGSGSIVKTQNGSNSHLDRTNSKKLLKDPRDLAKEQEGSISGEPLLTIVTMIGTPILTGFLRCWVDRNQV